MNQLSEPENMSIERLKEIFNSFNATTESLRATQERLTSKVEELQKELEEKNRELARKEKLAALGQMAAGIAHEIRNPLGGIELYLSTLARSANIGDREKAVLGKMMKGIVRLNRTVSDLLDYTRDVTPQPRDCGVAEILEESLAILAREIESRKISVDRNYNDRGHFHVDPDLLQHVFLNIILNAVQAVGEKGRIAVSLDRGADDRLQVTFEDTGKGIPHEVAERMFDPFFTSKSTGIGLGLAIVGNIVKAHNGEIRCGNREQGGAFFTIEIPATEGGTGK